MIGGHPVVDFDDGDAAGGRDDGRFEQRGPAGVEHVGAAVGVDQQAVGVARRCLCGGDDEHRDPAEGGRFDPHAEFLDGRVDGRGGVAGQFGDGVFPALGVGWVEQPFAVAVGHGDRGLQFSADRAGHRDDAPGDLARAGVAVDLAHQILQHRAVGNSDDVGRAGGGITHGGSSTRDHRPAPAVEPVTRFRRR